MADPNQLSHEYQAYIDSLLNERDKARNDATQSQVNYGQLSMYQSINPANLAELQLDLSKEKQLLEHVMRGHVPKRDKGGKEYWDATDDPERRIFTEYGVDRLMNFINVYISLNIILSYYLPDEVLAKMKIISDELADIFYLEYEYIFYKPTVQELMISKKIDVNEMKAMDDKQLERLYMKLKFEADVLYAKNKKQVYMIHNMLTNAVHSAYNRALWGKERATLRTMMHINESNNPNMQGQNGGMQNVGGKRQFKFFNPSTW